MIDVLKKLFEVPVVIHIWTKTTKSKKAPELKAPKLSFERFKLQNFKGVDEVEIDLVKNDLALLLGLNESGKSTILKGIESFSYMNDPTQNDNPHFFQSIRKKSQVSSNLSSVITAQIRIEDEIQIPTIKHLGDRELTAEEIESVKGFLYHLNDQKTFKISRVFPFKDGKPQRYFYRFETEHPFAKNHLSRSLAIEIVNVCPFILYFEDFKDRIPEKIYVNKNRPDSFDVIWYDIIDGLFYNTDESFNIEMFKKKFSNQSMVLDDAETVETRVNQTLNSTFTEKWKDLSGVKEISKTELKYYHHRSTPYFTLKVKDKDGTTYSVEERSRGALWYLSFLMKTEFRSKKLRVNSGKPVFLIDEPASNLHSTAQVNMIGDFKTLAQETSIIYTTHSQYLISLENIRNTFIIEKQNGTVHAHKWGDYLNKKDAKISYYQPLANLLNIIPNSFSIPWNQCLITEGPSDRHVLLSMYRILNGEQPNFAIYPGSSATNLASLISLNIGWNARFKILLDGDSEGKRAGKNYDRMFGLENELIYLPARTKKIENCIPNKEMIEIRNCVLGLTSEKALSKKEFSSAWALISENSKFDKEITDILSKETKDEFNRIFDKIEF